MNQVQSQLVSRHLPRAQDVVEEAYRICGVSSSMSTHLARLHLFLWKMALTDKPYDMVSVRSAMIRSGFYISEDELEAIDDLIGQCLLDGIEPEDAAPYQTAVGVARTIVQLNPEKLLAA